MVLDPSGEAKLIVDIDPDFVQYPDNPAKADLKNWINKFRRTLQELLGDEQLTSMPSEVWYRIPDSLDQFKKINLFYDNPEAFISKLPLQKFAGLKRTLDKVKQVFSKYPGGFSSAVADSGRSSTERERAHDTNPDTHPLVSDNPFKRDRTFGESKNMKLTKEKLKQIIKEELEDVLKEQKESSKTK